MHGVYEATLELSLDQVATGTYDLPRLAPAADNTMEQRTNAPFR